MLSRWQLQWWNCLPFQADSLSLVTLINSNDKRQQCFRLTSTCLEMADRPVTAAVGTAQQGQGVVKRFFELLMMLVSMVLVIFAWGEVSIVSKLFPIWNAHSAERRMRGHVKRERRKIYGRKERREKKRRDKREVEAEREDMRKGIVKREKWAVVNFCELWPRQARQRMRPPA